MTSRHPLADRSRWARIEQLAGDASTRSYARLEDRHGRTVILALYPAGVRRQLSRDLEVWQWARRHGLRVPATLGYDLSSGWVLLEDFGPHDLGHLLNHAPSTDRQGLLGRTVEPLVTLAGLDPAGLPRWNPPLDRHRLRWELAGFELWFVRHWRRRRPSEAVGCWLDELADEIGDHPRRVCHRDYHLNNLFLLKDGQVGVIDLQDVLVGPDTYDAVSLVAERDTPRLASDTVRGCWLQRWADLTGAQGGWQRRSQRVRIQRALKVLGTFARLTISGRADYRHWLEALTGQLAAETEVHGAPSDLAALLLD